MNEDKKTRISNKELNVDFDLDLHDTSEERRERFKNIIHEIEELSKMNVPKLRKNKEKVKRRINYWEEVLNKVLSDTSNDLNVYFSFEDNHVYMEVDGEFSKEIEYKSDTHNSFQKPTERNLLDK